MSQPSRKPLNLWERLLLPILLRTRRGDSRALLERRARYTRQLREYEQDQIKLAKELKKEGLIYAQLIVNCWVRRRSAFLAKNAHVSTDGKPVMNFKVVKPQFASMRTGPEQIWFRVLLSERNMWGKHVDKLPYGVDVAELTNEESLYELSFACKRKVQAWMETPERGAWIYVNRLEGVGGIPTQVSWEHVLPHYEGDFSRGPIVLGSGEMRDLRVTTLADTFHILIAGGSGGGKSNFIHSIISGLVRFCSPEEVQLILVDPKRLELGMYEEAPHLIGGIIFEAADAVTVLKNLLVEVERRTELFYNKATELWEWNANNPAHTLPRIVVVVDELAELMLMPEPEIAKEAQTLIVRLVNKGRALGIHLILATQYPDVTVISNRVKINVSLTVAARTQNKSQSIVIIGTGAAADLPKIPGRMLCMSGTDRFIVQTPKMRREDIKQSIAIAKGKVQGFITLDGHEVVINRDRVIVYIADELNCIINPEVIWRRLVQVGIPAQDLKAFLAEIVKAGAVVTAERQFTVQPFDGYWRLVETTPKRTERTDAQPFEDNPFNFAPDFTLHRLTDRPMLALPAPKPVEVEAVAAVEVEKSPEEVIKEFIAECCDVGKRLSTTTKELLEAYRQWCGLNNEEPTNVQMFGRILTSLGYARSVNGDGMKIRKGLAVSSVYKANAVA